MKPQEFSEWKKTYPNASYKDLGCDKKFPGAQKARWALRKYLVEEQRGLCCYCEMRIENGDYHVEHFLPKDKSLFPHLQLEYFNLHACCRKNPIGGDNEYCGHKKGNIHEPKLISPLEEDCEDHFIYDMSGNIKSEEDRGRISISTLNLNSTLLQRSRKSLIEEFEDMEDDQYHKEIIIHLNSDADILGEFFTTIRYLHHRGLLH